MNAPLPESHIAPAAPSDVDAAQLLAYFAQISPCKRRVVLAMVAAAARLEGGAA